MRPPSRGGRIQSGNPICGNEVSRVALTWMKEQAQQQSPVVPDSEGVEEGNEKGGLSSPPGAEKESAPAADDEHPTTSYPNPTGADTSRDAQGQLSQRAEGG